MKSIGRSIGLKVEILLLFLLVFNTGCEKNAAPVIQSLIANNIEMEAGESVT
jgi:hypothetical protein